MWFIHRLFPCATTRDVDRESRYETRQDSLIIDTIHLQGTHGCSRSDFTKKGLEFGGFW
jgi:hypothetical protein